MKHSSLLKHSLAAILVSGAMQANASGLFITEWMYSGDGGEFIELTNLSGASIDFTGYSYDDDSRQPGTFDLSGFGVVAAGESVVFTEDTAAQFRSDWGLDASVKVIGEYTNNIGRGDEINIYGSFNGSSFPLIDSLTYGDEDFPGSIRTKDVSGRPGTLSALGNNDVSLWVYSSIGDIDGSWASANGDIGSPGQYSAVPVPAAAWLFGSALLSLFGLRRKS